MISIIIPTLNEAANLSRTLDALAGDGTPREVLVVDAASVDGTAEIARQAGCQVIRAAARNRAAQMNAGAGQAAGKILLFLHADTSLPAGALSRIRAALSSPGVVGGGFCRRFAGRHPVLSVTSRMADWRGRWLGWFLGDQAIFAMRDAFRELGGFRDLPVFEDLDFCRRLKSRGRVVALEPAVVSSDRRFTARGPALTALFDAWLTARYLAGASPQQLRKLNDRWLGRPTR